MVQSSAPSVPIDACRKQRPEAQEDLPGTRARAGLRIAPLVVLQLILWSALLAGGLFRAGPNGRSLGVDFAVFLSGAQVLKHGGNPYDNHLLLRTEHAYLARQALPAPTQVGLVRTGNPPLFYWVLEPLGALPFRQVALLWIAAMFVIAALGFLACLQYLGWKHRWFPLVAFLLMPQVVLGACYGNIHAVVFAALGGALAMLRRHPIPAGMLLGIGWLKPQLVFPLVLLVLLAHPEQRKRLISGLLIASAALLALTVLALGPQSLVFWYQGLVGWSHDVGLEPNIASLAGLYAGWAPYHIALVLAIVFLALACGCTICAGWTSGSWAPAVSSLLWLWPLWFLATPFAHFPDEILLTLPALIFIGRDGEHLSEGLPLVLPYLLFFSVALFSVTVARTSPISLTLVFVVGMFLTARRGWTGTSSTTDIQAEGPRESAWA